MLDHQWPRICVFGSFHIGASPYEVHVHWTDLSFQLNRVRNKCLSHHTYASIHRVSIMAWMRGLQTKLVNHRALKTSPSCNKRWTMHIVDMYGETSVLSCPIKPSKPMVEVCLVWAWRECYEVQSQIQIHDKKNINYSFTWAKICGPSIVRKNKLNFHKT